jgi:hypothetical protein
MLHKKQASEIALLLSLLDRAYDATSWHGPNLKRSLRGLSADQAAWRPARDRKCVAEIVVHAAYWKYAARRRLADQKRGSFPRKGSNWFEREQPFTAKHWQACRQLLDSEHIALREAVAAFPVSRLHHKLGRGVLDAAMLIQGAAAHDDVYHAGQIQLLRRMQSSGEAAPP